MRVFRRIQKLHESLRAVLHDARHLLAVFAVFAADYQRSTSRSPRRSWAADGLAKARTASAPAVHSLFPAVLVSENPRNAKGSHRRKTVRDITEKKILSLSQTPSRTA